MTAGTIQVHVLAVHNGFNRLTDALAFRTTEPVAFEITLHGCKRG